MGDAAKRPDLPLEDILFLDSVEAIESIDL
jgi:hypothetical protein